MEGLPSASDRSNQEKFYSESIYIPRLDDQGGFLTTVDEYQSLLDTCRRKEPLFSACEASNIPQPKSSNLEKLRSALRARWFPQDAGEIDHNDASSAPQASGSEENNLNVSIQGFSVDEDMRLAEEFDTGGVDMDELLGFDDAEDGDEGGFEREINADNFEAFQTQTRVSETRRAEANRREGGIRTQQQVKKQWEEWVVPAIQRGELKDKIVDVHQLLRWIIYCAERPKKTPKGIEIPGTRIGAAHIKKLFFGVLRIRKEQEARDSSLSSTRPATSVVVWDALKSRMSEALYRAHNGLLEGEDAPDIVANTMLDTVTEDQIDQIGIGFLKHSHIHSVVNGHLAWTSQNGSGNRGDDLRALKLSELQPHEFLHPNSQTPVQAILGVQSEDKAGGRRMKTKINPVYSTWITHLNPERCPLGAFAFYFHYIHDKNELLDQMDIDWSINKSWRQVRVLHGPNSATTPYNEQNLYTLYVKAYAKAGFSSRLKAHLPRHLLGYRQERLGVEKLETSRMGWRIGATYLDIYAPSIPKQAVLGAHGFMKHEIYDPIWRRVHVPDVFLRLMCPMAEEIHQSVVGRQNLTGVTNYWQMVISLRPYLFLCGAALYEKCPDSALFRLPAFSSPSVIHWMTTQYRSELAALKAAAGSPVDLQRIQDSVMHQSLEQMRSAVADSNTFMHAFCLKMERRTAVLSPTKQFSNEVYQKRLESSARAITQPNFGTGRQPTTTPSPQADTPGLPGPVPSTSRSEMSIPLFSIDTPLSSVPVIDPVLLDEPIKPHNSRLLDLVLPPPLAFTEPGAPQLLWPPELGQRAVSWDRVYTLVKQPKLLWECWKPHPLDAYQSVEAQWIAYNTGETVIDQLGEPVAVKPPLRQVEQYFKYNWRDTTTSVGKKRWERFIEVPQFIEAESAQRGLSPQDIILELEALRAAKNSAGKKSLNALMHEVKKLRYAKIADRGASASTDLSPEVSTERKRKKPAEIRRHPSAKRHKM